MARKNHMWTIKDVEFMRVKYFTMTRKEIASHLGVSETNVRDALRRYRVPKPFGRKYKVWTKEDVEIIRQEYLNTTMKKLAARFGTSYSVVRGVVQRYGLSKSCRL